MSVTQTGPPRCADLMECPHHQEANPSTEWTQALLSFAAHAAVQYVLKDCCLLLHMQWYSMCPSNAVFCCTCSGTICTQATLPFAAHAVVQYVLKQRCLLLHMQWYNMHSSNAVLCCTCTVASLHTSVKSSQSQPALTLVVKERSSLAFTGEVHVKLSYVCMKTPAGSVTVCPPLSPELPSTELTKHNAPSKLGWRAR